MSLKPVNDSALLATFASASAVSERHPPAHPTPPDWSDLCRRDGYPWLLEDDAVLDEKLAQGWTHREIAAFTGRTKLAIDARVRNLRK